jgi:hypothetical protein
VLLDLHTVPDSQNGHDGGGLCGVCKWHQLIYHRALADAQLRACRVTMV